MQSSSSSSDAYEYDKSDFFRLLETKRFQKKHELIQELEGCIVCPLELSLQIINFPIENLITLQNDLINRHLFVPSPFYKNHYLPLACLRSSSNFIIDPTQENIHLILNNSPCAKQDEIFIYNQQKRICTDVKLLGVQTAYASITSDYIKTYKILIVDKELTLKLDKSLELKRKKHSRQRSSSKILNKIDNEIIREENDGLNYNSDFVSYMDVYGLDFNNEVPQDFYTNKSNSPIKEAVQITGLSDIDSFGKCIDFMNDCTLRLENSDQSDPIGACLIQEIELFKKTYIILPTHINHCAKQLLILHKKYFNKFMKAISISVNPKCSNLDLLMSLVCENTIVGCIFMKIWPSILVMNKHKDEHLHEKCSRLLYELKLNVNLMESDSEWVSLCENFFKIERDYFMFNDTSVLKEFKRVSLLNNPYEKILCIKSSIDLLMNEITVYISTNENSKNKNLVVSSDVLVPLIAFIILKSTTIINCLYSIVYFIDTFHLTSIMVESREIKDESSSLNELYFYLTTFKAAIKTLETIETY